MADEKPPSWVPVDQHVGQVPMALSRDVDTAGVHPASGQNASELATKIVRENQPVINRFVAMQRQHVELGEKAIHNSVLALQGMDVYYQNVQGLERMHYHISPQAEAPEQPEQLEEAKLPVPPVQELPEPPEEKLPPPEEKKTEPEFLTIDMMLGLAVEFGDRADDPPPRPRPGG